MADCVPTQLLESFNQREVEILRLMSEGLTNQEIAHKLFLSLTTIKWYNQIIFGKLGVKNRTRAIEQAQERGLIESPSSTTLNTPISLRHNLPAPASSFIGRKREIAALQRLIKAKDTRLVTILGPSGVGKTSLGLQVAYRQLSRFKDGVFFVSLSPLDDAGLVPFAISQALGIFNNGSRPVKELLDETLRKRQLLLLLDNFEHLLPAVPLVSSLLAAAPDLKILTTSRAPLGIYGENLFTLSPLSLPDPHNLPSDVELMQYESIRLFVERATAVQRGFALNAENHTDVAKICLRLDGLPLAIELAAARLHWLPPAEMAAQFDGREGQFPFDIFDKGPKDAPARHQTLRNAIAWSYDLLPAGEQALFRRMGVFAGGCTQEAMTGVCLDEPPLTEGVGERAHKTRFTASEPAPTKPAYFSKISTRLESLVEKSMVIQTTVEGERRYSMLEMIRAYALEQLDLNGEAEIVRQRHAEYFLKLVQNSRANLNSATGMEWVHRLGRERANLRGMLSWGLATSSDFPFERRAKRMLDVLDEMHLPKNETRQWLEKALSRLAEKPAGSFDLEQRLLQADLWVKAGGETYFQGDYPNARRFFENGLLIARKLNDKIRVSNALVLYCWTLASLGLVRQAKARAEEALELGKECEQPYFIGHALNQLGWLALRQRKYLQAEQLLTESVDVFKQAQDHLWVALQLANVGLCVQAQGDEARARELFQESLRVSWKYTNLWGFGWSLEKVARSAAAYGQHLRAVRLFSAAEALYQALDTPLLAIERPGHETYLTLARRGLDAASFEAAWAEGQTLPLERAVTLALEC